MKVWVGYGSEHSSNLVIIGKFESAKKATDVLSTLDEITRIARGDEARGFLKGGSTPTKFSEEMLAFCRNNNFHPFGYSDPEELLYDYDVAREGDKLVLTTEELKINAFLKIFLNGEAKIEVYSAHDHGGPYGRRTHA